MIVSVRISTEPHTETCGLDIE